MTTESDVIIGNGIAAHALLWGYARALKAGHLDHARRIVWIKSPVVPTCSLTSTSIVSSAGLNYGVSDLGDKLLAAYELFEKNFSDYKSVDLAAQTHIPHGDLENFEKRYSGASGKCFVIASQAFMQSLENDFTNELGDKLILKFDTMLDYDKSSVTLHSGEALQFTRLYLAIGAGHGLLGKKALGRYVAGHFASASVDLGLQSFVISRGPHNLIYRAIDKTVLVGSLDDKDDQDGWPLVAARANSLKKILKSFEYELPAGLNWEVHCGVRHKGVKRRPFWGKISDDVYSVHALYKNGYSLAFLAAQELLFNRTV